MMQIYPMFLKLSAATCLLATAAKATDIESPVSLNSNSEKRVSVCAKLNAKELPHSFKIPAMRFNGPAGDGRRGSAGFTLPAHKHVGKGGTGWSFTFQKAASGYGVQIIHPHGAGHVLVSVGSSLTIHCDGNWADIGWGNPASSIPVNLLPDSENVLPLDEKKPYTISSQLSEEGRYQLWINDQLICDQQIKRAQRLHLTTTPQKRIWGGSSWDNTTFDGQNFVAELSSGDAGLILSPMDGPGTSHCLNDITLSGMTPPHSPETDQQLEAILAAIESDIESGNLNFSSTVGGRRGGTFEIRPGEVAILLGFEYTASRHYAGHLTIKAVRPVFLSRRGEITGEWSGVPHGKVRRVCAEPGYALAGVVAKYGNRVDGMRLIFMKIQDGRLNPDDTYRSEWIGGRRGSPETLCAANGEPIIGIFGRRGADLDALGFVQTASDLSPGKRPNLQDLLPKLVGNWTITYTNATSHQREIHPSQLVNRSAELVEKNGDLLIVFPNVVERITLSGGKLFVEHFNPASTYPEGIPAVMGVGRRSEE